MGTIISNLKNNKVSPSTSYHSAGCIFYSKVSILAGYQPYKENPWISGFGGKKKNVESFEFTAFRETLEELFQFVKISNDFIKILIANVKPKKINYNNGYYLLIFTFDDLKLILEFCKKYNYIKSPLYRKFPTTIDELINNRVPLIESEVSYLALLPLTEYKKTKSFIDPNLLKDIKYILQNVYRDESLISIHSSSASASSSSS